MKQSPLLANITSELLEAQNGMMPKKAPKKVTAYVESDEDIAFWRNILKNYESGNLKFEILTPTHNGKQSALGKRNNVVNINAGTYLIICIDSDYDYLLPDYNEQSRLINDNPFIFQTYTYAIENYQCYAESLHGVCVQATKSDLRTIDFCELLEAFSEIIYPLFIWNLYLRKMNDHDTFCISDFCDLVKINNKIDITANCAESLQSIKLGTTDRLQSLTNSFPSEVNEVNILARELTEKGLSTSNTYLFIQGHTLKDGFILPILRAYWQFATKAKYAAINEKYGISKLATDERLHYKKQTQNIEAVLALNTEYKQCFLQIKMREDLVKYTAALNQSLNL